MSTPFVDFGRKTQYSVKKALGDTKSILPKLLETGQKWFAVSDYGECSGWVGQYFTCIKNGIVPILGMAGFVNNYRFRQEGKEFIVRKLGSDEEWEKNASEVDADELDWSQIDFPIDMFARKIDGYYGLIRIHNDAQINGIGKCPRTSDAFLKDNGKGIVALMPSPYSEISTFVYNGEFTLAKRKLDFYRKVFDDVYMEIPIVEDDTIREVNDRIIKWGIANDVPMIPVINTHYDSQDDQQAFEVLLKCGGMKKGAFSYDVDFLPNMYAKNLEEVEETFERFCRSEIFTREVFKDMMAIHESLCNSFSPLELDTSPKTPHFPNCQEELKKHAQDGLVKFGFDKKPNADVYRKRLEYELDNICRAGFADYFILIERMFQWHVNQCHRISSTGRGSAAGSLVLRCLGVTKIDPIEHNLLFERFLDASRLDEIINKGGKLSGADFPDVDSDFQSSCKEGIKEYFANTYGRENICSVGTVGYLKIKSTLKELARGYGIPVAEVNELTTVGMAEFDDKEDTALSQEELCEKFPALNDFLLKYPKLARDFGKLIGTIDHWGIHAGGILVSDSSLVGQLPLRVDTKTNRLVSCWSEGLNGRELGEMGFLKLDLLAIETLDIIEDAIQLINERHKELEKPLEFDDIPLDEKHSLSNMEKGMNLGVFQFETPLALRVAKDMGGIKRFDDLPSLSTLMRPAALQNKFAQKYGARRNGEEKYFVPECMKEYIGSEYGLPIYQEHIYHFARQLAGFDKVNSYKFMKLLYKGKMKGDKIPEWSKRFLDGCLAKTCHEEYDIEFEDGRICHFTEFDELICSDGKLHTVKDIVNNNLDVEELK